MARAIVTFARGWHSLAVVRSLGRQGIEVYCGEQAPFAPAFFSKYCKGSFQYPSVSEDPEGFLDFMVEKVKELKPPDGEPFVLIPIHKETWLIAKNRERFEPYISVPLTSYENMVQTHDKGKLALLAEELKITIPKTQQFNSIDDLYRAIPDLDFPIFLKMREGASGVGLKKVETPEDLTRTFKEFVEGYKLSPEEYPLVQQYVDGEDYCVTALYDQGQCKAKMTYHNVRAFPRGTGAGALREAVKLPVAEEAAENLLDKLGWHGIAQLDFRQHPDGTPYLIEVNPRFFGGLPQAIAANVDYPYLLFKIAAGEEINSQPEVDYSKRTEAPVVGLLATLNEIAHDDQLLEKFKKVKNEASKLGHSPLENIDIAPFLEALKKATNPKDMMGYLNEMFEKHRGTINDVLHSDDPTPALGVLFPVALMLKHGKLSMGVITSETEIASEKPRLSFRGLLRRPRWRVLFLTMTLFAISLFAMNSDYTKNNLGLLLGWPLRIAENFFGAVEKLDIAKASGALRYTAYHALNLLFLYILAALIIRQPPKTKAD